MLDKADRICYTTRMIETAIYDCMLERGIITQVQRDALVAANATLPGTEKELLAVIAACNLISLP